jgi:hypothetical protein
MIQVSFWRITALHVGRSYSAYEFLNKDTRKLSYPSGSATMLSLSRPGPSRSTDAYLARHWPNHETAAPVLPAGYVVRDHIP